MLKLDKTTPVEFINCDMKTFSRDPAAVVDGRAILRTTFKTNMIEGKAEDYYICCERAVIPLQNVPVFNSNEEFKGEPYLSVYNRNSTPGVHPPLHTFTMTQTFYSVFGLVDALNYMSNGYIFCELQPSGRMEMHFPGIVQYSYKLHPIIQGITGLSEWPAGIVGGPVPNLNYIRGSCSIYGLADRVDRIRLDIFGVTAEAEKFQDGSTGQVLTDFLNPRYFKGVMEYDTTTVDRTHLDPPITLYTPRQNFQLVNSLRRLIKLNGHFPVRNIELRLYVVRGTEKRLIVIPRNARLSVKLGIYKISK